MSRSGLNMMRYALSCPEEFSNPHVAFMMGFIQFFSTWVAELINIIKGS
jgi:hypothetical protein